MPPICITSLPLRVLLTIVIAFLATLAVYRGYGIFRADRIVRSEQSVESYSRALQYDSSNAVLWWKRGRLRHYSIKEVDIVRASEDYQRALSLNPRLSQAWVDLADCFERMAMYPDAETALENAIATHQYSPLVRWQAGNFFLRRGNLPKMYECFRMAGQYERDKLPIAIDIAWKVDPDHAGILEKLVPDDINSNLIYLAFLVGQDELDLAASAWKRCRMDAIPDGFEFKASLAFPYIDRLIAHNRISEAVQIWQETLRKSGFGKGETNSDNLMWNGSFEHELLLGGFDWRHPDTPEVRFRIDSANRMDQLKSLHMIFGDSNISSTFLYQIIAIPEPGAYKLDFYVRTENLTTDQLPYLAIQGYPDAAGASARSGFFPFSTEWRKNSIPFVVNSGCRAIQLYLRRENSSKFDNQIKGSMWLDGFKIVHQPSIARKGFLQGVDD
jgi:hypothetical protein